MDGANVLLVVLDSTRAQNTSLHGYERETTPFLDAFAERATVYRQARAPSIHSIASHVSLFTGTPVEVHEATRHTAHIDTSATVWADLRERGYATGLFTNNRIVSHASNLGEPFDHAFTPEFPTTAKLENILDNAFVEQTYFRLYDAVSRLRDALPGGDGDASLDGGDTSVTRQSGFKSRFGGEFVDAFLDWEQTRTGPWAACLNLMDTHSPYQPESEFDLWGEQRHWRAQADKPSVRASLTGEGWDRIEALEPLYDGTIRQADAIVEDLVAALEERGVLDETLVVITSDHGEAFGEWSRLNPDLRLRGHKWGVPEVLTHVPLAVSYPGQDEGAVVDSTVSLAEFPAVARAAADGEAGDGSAEAGEDPFVTDGSVLASTFRIPESKRSKYSSVENIDEYIGPWRAVYEDTDEGVRKFAQKGDRYVTVNIDAAGEATVISRDEHSRVREAYQGVADDDILTARTSEIDEDLEEQLEDLGYIR